MLQGTTGKRFIPVVIGDVLSRQRVPLLTLSLFMLLPLTMVLLHLTMKWDGATQKPMQKPGEIDYGFSNHHCYGWDSATRSCMFTNVCFSLTTRHWIWFQRSDPPSVLPQDTNVDINGTVTWSDMSSMMVRMATAYNHIKEKDETLYHPFTYEFGFKRLEEGPLVVNPLLDNSTTYLSTPHFLAARTLHDDNLGHLLFDSYFPILTVIQSFLGELSRAQDTTVVDLVHPKRPFGSKYFPQLYKKWLDNIANVIFKEYVSDAAFFERHKRISSTDNRVCFAQLIVGCGGLSGLEGHTLHQQRTVDYIRQSLWRRFVPKNLTNAVKGTQLSAFPPAPADLSSSSSSSSSSPEAKTNKARSRHSRRRPSSSEVARNSRYNSTRINVLMLEKVDTYWNHENNIKNWQQVVSTVRNVSGPYASVLSITPSKVTFAEQVRLFKEADIVMSLWGGISMVNFLMPPEGLEVLFSSWFLDLMPLPNATTLPKPLPCVDFDDRARSAFRHKVLLFCSRDDGMRSNSINLTNFAPFIKHALDHRRLQLSGLGVPTRTFFDTPLPAVGSRGAKQD